MLPLMQRRVIKCVNNKTNTFIQRCVPTLNQIRLQTNIRAVRPLPEIARNIRFIETTATITKQTKGDDWWVDLSSRGFNLYPQVQYTIPDQLLTDESGDKYYVNKEGNKTNVFNGHSVCGSSEAFCKFSLAEAMNITCTMRYEYDRPVADFEVPFWCRLQFQWHITDFNCELWTQNEDMWNFNWNNKYDIVDLAAKCGVEIVSQRDKEIFAEDLIAEVYEEMFGKIEDIIGSDVIPLDDEFIAWEDWSCQNASDEVVVFDE
eukprot:206395_1